MNPTLDIAIGASSGQNAALPVTWQYTTGDSQWLDAAAKKVAFVFSTPDVTVITRVALRWGDYSYGDVTTYRISLQGVDANGYPDGNILGAGSAYVDTTPTGTGNDYKIVPYTLDTPYTTAAGQILALVVAHQSGTIDVSHGSQIYKTLFCSTRFCNLPYCCTYLAAWAKWSYSPPIFGYGSATDWFGNPYQTALLTTFSANSNPDEYAVQFIIPTDICATYHLLGIRILGHCPAAAKTYTMTLYDPDGSTVLAHAHFDSDHGSDAALMQTLTLLFPATESPLLTAGEQYRISLAPAENSANMSWAALGLLDHTYRSAFPLGANISLSTRNDAGAWTDNTATRPVVEFLLTDVALSADPPDPDAVPNFPFIMIAASDGITPLTGATVTATVSIDGAEFVATANSPAEVADGLYKIDLDSADLAGSWIVLRLTADDAVTQHLTLQP